MIVMKQEPRLPWSMADWMRQTATFVAGNVACGKLSMCAFTEDMSGCVP